MMRLRAMLTIIAIATTAIDISACNEPTPSASTSSGSTTGVVVEKAAAPSPSIYPLRLALRDQNDEPISIDVFRGHPVIVTMFYGSCPMACPLLVSRIKQIEASLPVDVRGRTRVLLVSFDAERDTPTQLRELATAHRVDSVSAGATPRWRFATGPDEEVRQLANAIGVSYRKGADGAFSHNSVIAVLDPEGRLAKRTDDPQEEIAPLVSTISSLAR